MTTRDVGDGYPIGYEARDPDTRNLVDTTMALAVTDPSGNVTNPSPTHVSTGVYHYVIPLTATGRWRWRWTASGTITDTAYGEVWAADPAPLPLASTADLEYRLGRKLTDAEAAKAQGMLTDASSQIRSRTRRSFSATAQTVTLRPVGTVVRLPETPASVAQIAEVGTAGTADRVMSTSEWAWDGIDKIELWPTPANPDWPTSTGSYADSYRVTFTPTGMVPDEIVRICCGMVLRSLLAPTETPGMASETISSYSYRLEGSSSGISVVMTDSDEKALRRSGFLRSASTIQTRVA